MAGVRRTAARMVTALAVVAMIGGGLVATAPAARALTVVDLSGTLEIGGTPASGIVMIYTGTSGGQAVSISTTTDASGRWVLHPLSGTVGTLTFYDSILSAHVPLTVGSGDQVEDVAIPTDPVTESVAVVDGDGNPVPDVPLTGSTPGASFTTTSATSDGSPLTWGIGSFSSVPLCTTDATGTCSFATFADLPGTVSATVSDPYGADHSYPTTFTGQFTGTTASSVTVVVDWTHSLVDLSGAVTSGGSPVAGAAVSFDGLSTTTDASGRYILHPFPGSTGTLAVSSGASSTSEPVSVGQSDQVSDVVLPSQVTLVDLSGNVVFGSTPAGGATVSLGGVSTTTDASGHYNLHVAPGTTGTITVNYVFNVPFTATAPVVVGSTDQTDDINVPTGFTTGTVTVVDGSGAPLAGVPVQAQLSSLTSPVPGSTSDGSAVTWGLSYTTSSFLLCTTGSDGTCTSPGVLNIAGTISASVSPWGADPSYPGSISASVTGLVTAQGSFVLRVPTGSVVALSGTATLDGHVVAGAAVALGALHTVTDAAGHYTLHPFAGTTGSLSVTDGAFAQSVPVVVGDQDQGDDLTLSDPGAVFLSGTVDLGSSAVPDGPGVTVTFGGQLTTTDDAGSYAFFVPAGTDGLLSIGGGFPYTTPVSTGSSDQEADVVVPGVVLLSGTVLLTSSAHPDGPGVSVAFAGHSTTTDVSGHYVLPVPAGVSGTLTTSGIFSSSSPLTTGASDQTEDVTIPSAPLTAVIGAVDGAGAPLPDFTVGINDPGTPSPVKGTTSSGATVTWWTIPIGGSCVTGSDGTCTLPQAYTNIPVTLSGSLKLVPGDPSYPTIQTSVTTATPDDGSTMTLAFPNVSYLSSAGSVSGSVLLTSSGSTTIDDATSSQVPTALLPSGATAPVGSLSYSVHNVAVGGSVDVYVQLPAGTVPSAIYKELPDGSLVDVTSIATITGNTIDLHLTDGGPGDADGVANGVIEDPLIPVVGHVVTSFQVSTSGLAPMARNEAITPVTLQVAGATAGATLKWKKVQLPKGLKLSAGGVLSGTPSKKLVAGQASVSVQVTETVVTKVGKKKVKTVTTATAAIPVQLT